MTKPDYTITLPHNCIVELFEVKIGVFNLLVFSPNKGELLDEVNDVPESKLWETVTQYSGW